MKTWWLATCVLSAIPLVFGSGCVKPDDETALPEPDEHVLRFDAASTDLVPGEEVYLCHTMRLTEDVVVRGVTPRYGPATHHLGLFRALGAEEPDGVSACPVVFKESWIPLFAGGVDTDPMQVPEGAGIALEAGQQLVLQLHLLNAAADAVTTTSGVDLKTVPAGDDFVPAGIFGLDNRTIAIPAATDGATEEMDCKAKSDMEVFAAFGHMHTLGRALDFVRVESDEERSLIHLDWSFDDQPTLLTSFSLAKGEPTRLRCTYDNPHAEPALYGEKTEDEMCILALYYTPYGGLNGCLKLK